MVKEEPELRLIKTVRLPYSMHDRIWTGIPKQLLHTPSIKNKVWCSFLAKLDSKTRLEKKF